MNSFEWRLKKLEDRILGQVSCPSHSKESNKHILPVFDQLNSVAKHYKNFEDKNYIRFVDLYSQHKNNLDRAEQSDISKAELVLAYEADLNKYLNDTVQVAEKAEKVLDIEKWPDLSGYEQKLTQLQTITAEQHLKSTNLDKRTEELIEIYNDIIGAFKRNMVVWEEKLDNLPKEEQ